MWNHYRRLCSQAARDILYIQRRLLVIVNKRHANDANAIPNRHALWTCEHGDGVITKLHFAIFAAFKESRSEVTQDDFGTSRTRVYIFLLTVNSNLELDPILHRFSDTAA